MCSEVVWGECVLCERGRGVHVFPGVCVCVCVGGGGVYK